MISACRIINVLSQTIRATMNNMTKVETTTATKAGISSGSSAADVVVDEFEFMVFRLMGRDTVN